MFIGRQKEITYLDELLAKAQAGTAQLCLVGGRKRSGKTELLLHWAKKSGLPFIYWAAVKEPGVRQRMRLAARVLDKPLETAPAFGSWVELWDTIARGLTRDYRILIIDNLPYASESDEEMLPALKAAWERYFRTSGMTIVLCGTHGRVMNVLSSAGSMLREQITAILRLEPLPFSALHEFFPDWEAEKRVSAYAIGGGVPAYLGWLRPDLDLADNFQQVILHPASRFLSETDLLLYDELREPANYLGIMKAINSGANTLTDISVWTGIPVTSVTFYLSVLQDLHLVERRLPVTVLAAGRARAKNGRYFIADSWFRFYLRFLEPFISESPWTHEKAAEFFQNNMSDFVGRTVFPELARNWLQIQSDTGNLPFQPEAVGCYWNSRVQMDVVGINQTSRDILLAECKWRADPVEPLEIRALTESKMRWVLRDLPDEGEGWQVHYAYFARKGFLPAAYGQLQRYGGLAVNLNNLDTVLGRNEQIKANQTSSA